ncbi:MAG TPA: riboflavin biosynthesis protein RibF [bacterium]
MRDAARARRQGVAAKARRRPSWLVRGRVPFSSPPPRAVVTVGVFDGVHVGHRRLIRDTVARAAAIGGTSVAVTFDPDPHEVLAPQRAPLALMPVPVRCRILHALGIERVWVIPFTRAFAGLSAREFIRQVLIEQLAARVVVVGVGFAFGRGGAGDPDLLARAGLKTGMRVIAVPPVMRGGRPVSSSRIRTLIGEGRLSAAARLSGRPPMLYGRVIRGSGRGGRRVGVRTANLALPPQIVPPEGVYAVMAACPDGRASASTPWRRAWRGVMNFGVRPTFGAGRVVCEVHLFGFSGSLYGRELAVAVLARLRGERCFPSPQALAKQIRRDAGRARRLLKSVRWPNC